MSEINPELAPYIHPTYWNGHTIGEGETEPFQPGFADAGSWLSATRGIREYIKRANDNRFALETLRPGDVFDPQAYSPGTITFFKTESLIFYGTVDLDFSGIEDVTPAIKNPVLPAGTDFLGSGIRLGSRKDDGLTYNEWLMWGVVYARRDGTNSLVYIPATLVVQQESGRVWTLAPALEYTKPVTIDGVMHEKGKGGWEKLERVLSLEVCAYGSAKRQRDPKLSTHWLGRLVTGEGTA